MKSKDVKIGEEYAYQRGTDLYSPSRVRIEEVVQREVGRYPWEKRLAPHYRVVCLDRETGEVLTRAVDLIPVRDARCLHCTWVAWLDVQAQRRENERERLRTVRLEKRRRIATSRRLRALGIDGQSVAVEDRLSDPPTDEELDAWAYRGTTIELSLDELDALLSKVEARGGVERTAGSEGACCSKRFQGTSSVGVTIDFWACELPVGHGGPHGAPSVGIYPGKGDRRE